MSKPAIVTPLKPIIPSLQAPSTRWHSVLTDFFQSVGLYETVRGFEADLLVLSRAQHERLPVALQTLGEQVELF
jgi:hypothetical protein